MSINETGENGRLERNDVMYGDTLLLQTAAAFATAAANLFCCVSLSDDSPGEMDTDASGGGGGKPHELVMDTSLFIGVVAMDANDDVFCAEIDVFFCVVLLLVVVASYTLFRFKFLKQRKIKSVSNLLPYFNLTCDLIFFQYTEYNLIQ